MTESDHEIKMSRREFSKAMIGFGAAAVGLPGYNLTDMTDMIFKEDGKLTIYPVISEYKFKFESAWKLPFKRFICINCWGCNWNCGFCPTKFSIFKDMTPIEISIDQITGLLLNFHDDPATMVAISGGEPLLQKEEVLKLIESLKTETKYTVMLATNGSLIEEDFIDKTNDLGLDGINISFRHTDEDWHKYYTGGHRVQSTVDALKLVTKKFKGEHVVSISAGLDVVTFEDVCNFLHKINPNFVIKIFHPRHEMEWKKRQHEVEEIALRYFSRMDRTGYFSKQIKSKRYQIEEEESGNVKLIIGQEWIKKKEAMKYG